MNETEHDQQLLTIEETLEALRIGRDLLYRLIRSGELPSVKIGSRRFITRGDASAFIRRQRQAARHV